MTMVPLLVVLEPLISPHAASRSAAPSARAPPPIVRQTCRRLNRLSNDNPWSAMSASPPYKGFKFVSTRNIVSEPAHVNLSRRPPASPRSPDPARPAGALLALERRGLRRGDLAAVRRPLRAAGGEEHRPENPGRTRLARPLDDGRGGRPAQVARADPALPGSAGWAAQPVAPDGRRGAHHRAPDPEGRSHEPSAGFRTVRARAVGAAADAQPRGRRR